MLHNYFITAFRNFSRQRLYSTINIFGLAAGLACTIFIGVYLRDELSFDTWMPESENLYRAEVTFRVPGGAPIVSAISPFLLGSEMEATLPGVVEETHIMRQRSTIVTGRHEFAEPVYTVGPNFFLVFRLPLIAGNVGRVLAQPESVVLSESNARKYFGTDKVLGKFLTIDSSHRLRVTGVMRDLPHNTQLDGGIFISDRSNAVQLSHDIRSDWSAFVGWTYVRLSPAAKVSDLEARAGALIAEHISPPSSKTANERAGPLVQVSLVPFRNVHLTSDYTKGGMRAGGNRTTMWGLAAIAILVLAAACFNFTNLATARATVRSREVGMRKAVGALRPQLIAQFLGESVMMALLAMIVALAIVEMLTVPFDRLVNRPIALDYATDGGLVLAIVGIAMATGLAAGFYPAIVLSRHTPAVVLGPRSSGQTDAGVLRAALIVFQFGISISLAVAALVIFAQIRYARQADIGLKHDRIVIVSNSGQQKLSSGKISRLLHVLNANSDIVRAAQSNAIPFEGREERTDATIPGTATQLVVAAIDISPEFPIVYGMKLLKGRLLSSVYRHDASKTSGTQNIIQEDANVVVDASAAHAFGFAPGNAVGRIIKIDGKRAIIVGVVQNALFLGARAQPLGSVYYLNPDRLTDISVRIRPGHAKEALQQIDGSWHTIASPLPIRRHFLQHSFDRLLDEDRRQGTLFAVFVGIAIIIACLGLLGLAAFTAQQRTCEIGVRKAFGASTMDIVRLLLWQFSVPVVLANVIAWPVAWYYLNNWLEGYSKRIVLTPVYFIAAGTAALAIAWVTVLAHAVRVARANPIDALRYE